MNIKSAHLLIILLLLFTATSCGVKSIIKKGDNKYAMGEYYNASNIYKRAYRSVPGKDRLLRGEVAFKLGNSYRLVNNNQRAEAAYKNAVRYKYKDDIVYLYYAEVLRKNGKYKEALSNYQLYLKTHPDNIWAQNGVLSCQEVQAWSKEKSRYEIKKADVLNSKKFSEFSPAFANSDGDVVYFNSTRDNTATGGKNSPITGLRNNDFFMARKNAVGNWEAPIAVEGELNTTSDEGTPSFTSDGKTMYFTRARSTGSNAEIYKSTRAGAQWSGGEKVMLLKDSTLMTAHPAISPDGDFLYFVSDMPGGQGGKDIWRVELIENKWGVPENLGPEINTPGDEMFPYVRANGDLYFSSNGHPGFGGLDIFRATFADEKWTVENLREPINSAADDFGITFAGNEESGFFSSTRKETKNLDKIWSFGMKKIEYILYGKITDTKGEALSDAVLRVVGDDGTNTKVRTHKDGTYRFELKPGVQYVMLATDRGFLNSKQEITTAGLKDSKDFPINFQLASVSKPVQVNNIFYEFGKWTLTPDSEAGIKDLAKLLNDNPNITMEIGAHTDMVGSEQANIELSKKRAQEIVNYLIRSGIEPDRLTAVGYGETVPVVVTPEIAKQYPFLKDGDVLNEEFVMSRNPQEQEIMNQINRRTEFKVLKTTYKMY